MTFTDTKDGETHSVCDDQLRKLGNDAPCCGCFPHGGCEISSMDRTIGMMRVWLNEDRITDPKKMVTTEELAFWISKIKQAQ
jgi:hypothetical protein